MTDQTLIDLLRSGNGRQEDQALNYLQKEYRTMTRKLILTNSGGEENVREVLIESLVILYNKVVNPEFELKSQLSTFFYGICKNRWMDKLRARKNSKVVALEAASNQTDGDKDAFDSMVDSQIEDRIHQAIGQLSKECREVILHKYFKKSNDQALCELLGYKNTNVVKAKRNRCMQQLRDLLSNDDHFNDLLKQN